MENLKKELQEKGYTFFKMQDYSEFADEYIKYKQYICNSENNLLNCINSVRFDAAHSNTDIGKSGSLSLNMGFNSFEEAEYTIDNEYLKFIPELDRFSQFWFYGQDKELINNFKPFIGKIVSNLYGVEESDLSHLAFLSYYKKGCFLEAHRDGKCQNRICAVLIYLNDEEYNSEWGGNIIFEGTESVEPIYGNIAVLDFKEGNCLHEVKEVIDGYGRYAILDFVSLGDTLNIQNNY